MHLTGHRSDCLFVRDGGRSICTCWPESSFERAALKETTLNEIGLALARNHDFIAGVLGSLENRIIEHHSWLSGRLCASEMPVLERLKHIEEKVDVLGEALDKKCEDLEDCSDANWLQTRTLLDGTAKWLNTIDGKLDVITRALIDQQPKFKPVRRATKKGKRR